MITVEGADRLARTARAASKDIVKLTETHRSIGNRIRGNAHPPRRSGRLAASLTVEATERDVTVSSGLVYAPVIENGWPGHNIRATRFLGTAFAESDAGTLNDYADHVDSTLKTIKGK